MKPCPGSRGSSASRWWTSTISSASTTPTDTTRATTSSGSSPRGSRRRPEAGPRLYLILPFILYAPGPASAQSLFHDRAPLTLQLQGDLHALFGDRGTQRKDHAATLRYGGGADTGSIEVKLRTRGIFRLKRCGF